MPNSGFNMAINSTEWVSLRHQQPHSIEQLLKAKNLLGNYGKARALDEGSNYKQALVAINQAIVIVPKAQEKTYYYLWKYQGVLYEKLGNYQEALISFDKAIALSDSSDSIVLNEKAIILATNKQLQKSIDIYDLIIKKEPEAYAYYNRGIDRSDLGNKQAAIDDYNMAIKINPNYADAYTNRGLAKSTLGNQQAAIDDFDIAIKFKPNNLQAYINRGWSNFLSNHNQGAIADWGKSISLEPTAGAYCNLGLYKVILGNNAEGLVDLEQAIKLDPKLADNFVVRGFI